MIRLTGSVLRGMPLPMPGDHADKNDRGRLLVVAGSQTVPGAALLCAEAALRAGAGKVQVAVPERLSAGVGIALPETAVIGLPEGDYASVYLMKAAAEAEATLVGPGIMDESISQKLTEALLNAQSRLVLDAGALAPLKDLAASICGLRRRPVLTPHAGEMAGLLGWEKERVEAEPVEALKEAIGTYQAVVALKGAVTYIGGPDSDLYCNEKGPVGLGTGGSGDVLAGLIGALRARGCSALQAAVWGVFVHALAGTKLSQRVGKLGFLGRELPAEFPGILDKLCA